MKTIADIAQLLRLRIGLDAASVGGGVVERAVRARMTAVQAPDESAYWRRLHADVAELQALIEAVVVPETWFFRHNEAFHALVRAALALAPGAAQLRLASVPCSTGEEPYSLAMALLDAGLSPERFVVDAVDISAHALARAKAGVYGRNAFRGAPLDFRDRHFEATAHGYRIADRVRASVRLHQGNLLDPALLAGEPRYHFVFCRNLLIYFDEPTRELAVQRLAALARPDGMLFVGPAEANLMSRRGFVSARIDQAFAFHPPHAAVATAGARATLPTTRHATPAPMPVQTRQAPPVAAATTSATSLGPSGRAPAAPRNAAFAIAHHPRATRQPSIAATGPAASSAPVATPAPLDHDALDRIARLADQGNLHAAIQACHAYLAQLPPSAAALCLLGVLHDAQGQSQLARDAYRRALYLDPGHQEALHHLAAHLEAEGDRFGAQRLRARAERATQGRHG